MPNDISDITDNLIVYIFGIGFIVIGILIFVISNASTNVFLALAVATLFIICGCYTLSGLLLESGRIKK